MSISAASARAWKAVALALALVALAIVASVAGALVPRATIDPTQTRVEAAGQAGIDAFTGDLRLVQERAVVPAAAPSSREVDGRADGTTQSAPEACDIRELIASLESDLQKQQAWVGVFDLEPTELGEFIGGLEPAMLMYDVVVMNHGYRGRSAQRVRTILQAGTLVLVDGFGVPRVLCKCGNPLLTTAPVGREEPVGDAWPGFDAERVISLVPIPITPTPIPEPTVLVAPPVTSAPTAPPIATPLPEPTARATVAPSPTAEPSATVEPSTTATAPPATATPAPTATATPAASATPTPEPFVIVCTVEPALIAADQEFTMTFSWTPADVPITIVINDVVGGRTLPGVTSPHQHVSVLDADLLGGRLDFFATGQGIEDRGLCPYESEVLVDEECTARLPSGECCPETYDPEEVSADVRVSCPRSD